MERLRSMVTTTKAPGDARSDAVTGATEKSSLMPPIAPPKPPPPKLDTVALDGLRGLATLLVASFHLLRRLDSPVIFEGQAAIPIFYFLSGFLLELGYGSKKPVCTSPSSTGIYFVRRLARLWPTYVLANAIAVPNIIYTDKDAYTSYTFVQWLSVLAMITDWLPNKWTSPTFGSTPYVPASTISCFFFLYVCYPALSALLRLLDVSEPAIIGGRPARRRPDATRLRTAGAAAAAFYALGYVLSYALSENVGIEVRHTYYGCGIFAIPCFLSGVCAGRARAASVSTVAPQDSANTHAGPRCGTSDACFAVMGIILVLQAVHTHIQDQVPIDLRTAIASSMSSPGAEGDAALQQIIDQTNPPGWQLTVAGPLNRVSHSLIFAMVLPTYPAVLALTQPGAPHGFFDTYVLRARWSLFLGEISMAFCDAPLTL
jgi:peptidoglycan/LPS O-acetylase OafA/YrhL